MSNISDFNKYYQQQSINIKRILQEFNKNIHQNCFFSNINLLREQSDFILFDNSKWKMRPEVFCYDYYGEHNYSPIILLVNNISSIFDFLPENLEERIIISPKESTIMNVLNSNVV